MANSTVVLWHPSAYCLECELTSYDFDKVCDENDTTISETVICDKCEAELDATEIIRVEHEEY